MERSVSVVSIEAGGCVVGVAHRSQPGAEADSMGPERRRGVVLQLIVILGVTNSSIVAAASGKGSLHSDGRCSVKRKLIIAIANILKPRFIDQPGAEHLGVADLQSVFLVECVIALGLQGKLRHSVIGALLAVVHVADRERVRGRELEVNPRA